MEVVIVLKRKSSVSRKSSTAPIVKNKVTMRATARRSARLARRDAKYVEKKTTLRKNVPMRNAGTVERRATEARTARMSAA